jgi:hypothetical protein
VEALEDEGDIRDRVKIKQDAMESVAHASALVDANVRHALVIADALSLAVQGDVTDMVANVSKMHILHPNIT